MTVEQIKWCDTQISIVTNNIERNWPLNASQWVSVTEQINQIYKLSKYNHEVLERIFDAIEPYDRRANRVNRISSTQPKAG